MKGIYFTVPDNEFSFYMAVLERFKTATILKTDEIKTLDLDMHLHAWQVTELEEILKEESVNPQPAEDSKIFLTSLRKELGV